MPFTAHGSHEMRADDSSACVAVGLLSAAGSTEKSNASTGQWRRTSIRSYVADYQSQVGSVGVALRFVLAAGGVLTASILEEAKREGDMIFINMTEGIYRCTRKYLEWLRIAPTLFQRARFFALGDDDIYVSLAHLESDLRSVGAYTNESERVLWGLVMWKAYFNNATLATHTGFASWDYYDWSAVAQRRSMHKCHAAMARRAELRRLTSGAQGAAASTAGAAAIAATAARAARAARAAASSWIRSQASSSAASSTAASIGSPQEDHFFKQWLFKVSGYMDADSSVTGQNGYDRLYPNDPAERTSEKLPAACAIIRHDHIRAVLTDGVAASPPFPYIDGPLFAVSRALATALATDPIPRTYLDALHRRYDRAGPQTIYGMSCWPTTDSIFGYWTTAVALRTRVPVTLVNTPQNRQHISWPSWRVTNHTIVMHGIRSVENQNFLSHARLASRGAFEPYVRTCGRCGDMGWVTWPGSPLHAWRCCGASVDQNGARLKACTGKACPNVPLSVLRAVYYGPGDGLISEYTAPPPPPHRRRRRRRSVDA